MKQTVGLPVVGYNLIRY